MLVPTLLYAQDEVGYLNHDVIHEIAQRLDLTDLEVSNVISYYSVSYTHLDVYKRQEYYRCPHLYCLYANDGMPYEGFGYYVINEPDSYEFELPIQHRVDLTSLLGNEGGSPTT